LSKNQVEPNCDSNPTTWGLETCPVNTGPHQGACFMCSDNYESIGTACISCGTGSSSSSGNSCEPIPPPPPPPPTPPPALCSRGYYSPTGRRPCETCRGMTYNNSEGKTYCNTVQNWYYPAWENRRNAPVAGEMAYYQVRCPDGPDGNAIWPQLGRASPCTGEGKTNSGGRVEYCPGSNCTGYGFNRLCDYYGKWRCCSNNRWRAGAHQC